MNYVRDPRDEPTAVGQIPPATIEYREVRADDNLDVVATPIPAAQVRTQYASRFTPDAIVGSAVGLILLVVGLLAVTRAGFDGPMSSPVREVLGFTHTTTLGLIEIGIGACLLISSAMVSRSGEIFFGGVLGIAGFVGAVQAESFTKTLALESSMAWLAVAAAVVTVLAALLMPRVSRTATTIVVR